MTLNIILIVLPGIGRPEKFMSNYPKYRKYRYNLEVLASRLPLVQSQLDDMYSDWLKAWSSSLGVPVPSPDYEACIMLIQHLGLAWTRDPLGKHKVFIPKHQI